MGQPGRVIAVAQRTLSASLAVDADSADTELTVDNPSVFADEGGTATINPDDSESPLTVTYTAVDGDVVTLSEALGVDVPASSLVTPEPEVALRVATVRLGGDGEAGSVEAVIDTGPASHPRLALGVLDEPVSVWVEDGGVAGYAFTLTRLLGHEPAVQGDTIVGPLPNADIPAVNPVAPSSSPTPAVDGFAGVVLLRWVAVLNDTYVEYDVHVSTTDATPPDSSTLVDSTGASMDSIRTLADGSPLEYDTTYYFALWARSDDQYAPAPSTWVPGQMDRTKNADLAADAIDGMTITGATIRTAATGQRVQMDVSGIHSYDSSNTETASLEAGTGGLELAGNLTMQSTSVYEGFFLEDSTKNTGVNLVTGALVFSRVSPRGYFARIEYSPSGGSLLIDNESGDILIDPGPSGVVLVGNADYGLRVDTQGEGMWPNKMLSGATSLTFSSAATTVSVDVDFDDPIYGGGMQMQSAPHVVATPTSATNSNNTLNWWITNQSVSGFRLNAQRSGAATIGFNWIAIAP